MITFLWFTVIVLLLLSCPGLPPRLFKSVLPASSSPYTPYYSRCGPQAPLTAPYCSRPRPSGSPTLPSRSHPGPPPPPTIPYRFHHGGKINGKWKSLVVIYHIKFMMAKHFFTFSHTFWPVSWGWSAPTACWYVGSSVLSILTTVSYEGGDE